MSGLKLCGVVTLYNPTDEIISNIGTYIDGLGVLYVVDNSPEYNERASRQLRERYGNVEILSSGKNIGVAAALNLAISRSLDDGYEFLMTMDQDSYFEEQQYQKYLKSLSGLSFSRIALVSPLHDSSEYVDSGSVVYERQEDVATSGSVINLSVARKVGLFDEKLFIDSVDQDYCLRANILGYDVLQTQNCYLCHCIGEKYDGTLFMSNRKRRFYIHSPKRMYFIVRNSLFIRNKYRSDFPDYTRAYARRTFERVSKCIRYSHQRTTYTKYIIMALYDYVSGHYGNRVNI
jgi:rhamnosyltransferase